VVGIGLGDIAYLNALTRMGVRRTLLVGTLSPPLTALAAWALLGEKLTAGTWLGLALTVAGVAWVITERRGLDPNGNGPAEGDGEAHWTRGLGFGLLFALAQVASTLFSRAGFNREAAGAFEAAEVRLLAAIVAVLPMLLLGLGRRPRPLAWRRSPQAEPAGRSLLWGSLIGPFTAMVLLQLSLKLAPAGITQTLTSTNALFAVGFAALQGEKVSPRSVFGVLLALAGVVLIFSWMG
jgi:drug/metabolite transporter (DMT)-like permease